MIVIHLIHIDDCFVFAFGAVLWLRGNEVILSFCRSLEIDGECGYDRDETIEITLV